MAVQEDRAGAPAERALLWVFLLLAVAVWGGVGGLIFVGILENVSR